MELKTPHIYAKDKRDIASVVIMPGDPMRAKNFAHKYLKDIVEFNGTRGMTGYTGTYDGVRISVHASGMGFGSAGIYYYELFALAGVKCIIRMGTSGSYDKNLHVGSLIVGKSFYSESNFFHNFTNTSEHINTLPADPYALKFAIKAGNALKVDIQKVQIHSTNIFYRQEQNIWERYKKEGHECKAVEMEGFALTTISEYLRKNSLTICAISDNLITHEVSSSEARAEGLGHLFKVTLKTATLLVKSYD